jgi:5-methylcytosine-specific restriction protein A
MKLIDKKVELIENLETVENYLTAGTNFETEETEKLIKRGTCFVAYKINKEIRFAPSRFIGYKKNQLTKHLKSKKDGRHTTFRINKILGTKAIPNKNLETFYLNYCNNLGVSPSKTGTYGAERKYWTLDIDTDFKIHDDSTDEFPEGKIIERKHKVKERNPKVVKLAKENFKRKNGSLFCQVCKLNFEKIYGKIGIDFIEGHHIIPVSEMKPDHISTPEDIVLLCSNCHRMVHKYRPWLDKNDIGKVLLENN